MSVGKVMANTKRVQFRRGTDAEHQVFTGAPGEITVNTSNNSIHVHDGVTPAGVAAARSDFNNVTAGIITGSLRVGGANTLGTHSYEMTVGVGETAGVIIDGGVDIYGSQNIVGSSTITDGNFSVSGATTTSSWGMTVGHGTTEVIIQGNARITGILSVGQNTISIDGNTNKISVIDLESDTITSNNFNFVSIAQTTFTHSTETSDIVAIGGTIIPVVGLNTVAVGDFVTISPYFTNAKVVGIGSTTVTTSFTKIIKFTSVVNDVGVGATSFAVGNLDGVIVGNSIDVGNFISGASITGISSIATSTTNTDLDIFLTVTQDADAGATQIAVGSTSGIGVGNSVTTGSGGTSFVADGGTTTERITAIGTIPVGTVNVITNSTSTVGSAGTDGELSIVGGGTTFFVDSPTKIDTGYTVSISGESDNTVASVNVNTGLITLSTGVSGDVFSGTDVDFTRITVGFTDSVIGSTQATNTASAGANLIEVNSVENVSIGSSVSVITGDLSTELYFRRIAGVNTATPSITIDGTLPFDVDAATTLEYTDRLTTLPAITLANGVGAAVTANTTTLSVSSAEENFSPAVSVSSGSTETITSGTQVSISSFTNNADTVLIRPGAASTSEIALASTIDFRRESSSNTIINPASSEIGNLNVTGIATLGELTYPMFDGKEGQVLQTDGNGNIVFGAGGNSGSDTIIFVSSVNGNDENDGILLPVKTIKKGAQLASKVQKTEVSVLVETGEYLEDNPIIVYDNVSIIGDSLRNIVVRPLNAGKDLFKVRNGCYITGMTFNDFVDGDTKVPQHTWDYAIAFDDPFDTNLDRTGYASTEILKLTNAIYTKETGITTFTTEKKHDFYRGNTARVAGIAWTCGYDEGGIRNINYDHISGVSTLTFYGDANFTANNVGGATSSSKYYWSEGQRLYLNNLMFECSPEHIGLTTGTYPYPGLDDTYGAVYPITGVNTATKQITIQGGVSTIPHVYKAWESLGISTFEYDNVSGICTIETRYRHNLNDNDNITLGNLPFTCSAEHTGVTTHVFPDGTLNAFNHDGYTFKVRSSGIAASITGADYDGVSGIMTVTSPSHGMSTGDELRIATEGISFTCDQDDNQQPSAYPRATDPAAGQWLSVTVIDANTLSVDVGNAGTASTSVHTYSSSTDFPLSLFPNKFTVNAGTSTIPHTYEGYAPENISGFTYDAYTGIATVTTAATLNAVAGEHISLVGLQLTCTDQSLGITKDITFADYDHISGVTTIHTKNAHDLKLGSKIHLEDLRFECDYGISVYPKGEYFTPTDVSYNTANGDLVFTIGSHSLTTNDYIDIADNSIAFTCTMDGGQEAKTYPRAGIDPYAGRSIQISGTTATQITVNVGSAGTDVYFTPTGATYDPSTGVMEVTVGQHGLGVGRGVVLEDNSFTFTCLTDPGDPKTYPRPGQDPFAGKSIPITSVGMSTHTATDAPYNAGTGAITVTVVAHGFANGDFVLIEDDSLTYNCVLDGNVEQKSYPRKNYDYASGRWLRVSNVTTDTFDINIGASSYTGAHTFISASSNGVKRQTGTFTLQVGTSSDTSAHTFVSATANAIKHEPQAAHTFNAAASNLTNAVSTSGKDLNVLSVISPNKFTVNVGVSTLAHTYLDKGVLNRYYTPKNNVTAADYDHISGVTTITAPGSYFNPGEIIYLDGMTFSCAYGTDTYPSGNLGYGFTVTSVTNNEFDTFTFVCNVGVSTLAHTYVSGGTVQSGITTTIFPDGTSYPRDAFEVLTVNNATEIEIQVGKSDIPHTYISGGTAQVTPITRKVGTAQQVQYYPELNRSGKIDFGVVNSLNDLQFLIRGETNERDHFYTQGGQVELSKPKINKSPYIQNCSILSSLGGNGILVDGDKIISTNRGLIPELGEIPVVLPSPEFGKSMVAATFTMISFGGIGWRTINDGYAQVVSCFQIFCGYGSLCQSGGYLSITNSATNFGRFSLRATGYSRNSFVFDRGRVVNTGTSGGLQTLRVVGLGRSDQQLYVLKFLDNDLADRTPDFKPSLVTQQFTGANISTETNVFNIAAHPFQNEDSVIYEGNEDANPRDLVGGLVNNGIYYVGYIDASNFKLYLDEGLDTAVNIDSSITGVNTFTKNSIEFFVDDIIEHHQEYQQLQLASTPTSTWVAGREVTQSGSGAVGFAVTYLSDVNSLIVSVEEVGGVRNVFNTSGAVADHAPSPVAMGVTGVVGLTTYHTINFKVNSTDNASTVIGIASLVETYRCHMHRPSIINSSAHTWEYSGSGTDYNALPQNGGQSQPNTEQISELGGRVFASGTTELGDFKIGSQITAFNRTGSIVFNNKVTIGELDSIRLSLSGGVAIEEFSTDVGLGENETGGPQNKRVATQLAVRSFLSNRLGTFIDKVVSTNAIPNAVVQLNSNGQINSDLIPPKVVNFVQTNVAAGRTVLVNEIPAYNIIQGDTVVEPDDAFVLVNDTLGQYLIIDNNYGGSGYIHNFSNGDNVTSALSAIVTGVVTSPPGGIGIGTTIAEYTGYGSTGYVRGVGLGLEVTQSGSGYNNAGIYSGIPLSPVTGSGSGMLAIVTINISGQVNQIDVLAGGKGYMTNDILTVSDPNLLGGRTGGADVQLKVTDWETRLYVALTNNQKFAGSAALNDYIADANAGTATTTLTASYSVPFDPTDIGIGGDVDFANDRIVIGASEYADGDPVLYNTNGGNILVAGGQGILNLTTYYTKVVGAGTSVEIYRNYSLTDKVEFTGSGGGTHEFRRDTTRFEKNTIAWVNHGFNTGEAIRVSGQTPLGISTGSFYYTGSITQNSFTLHETASDAGFSVAGVIFNEVGIAASATGSMTFTESNVRYNDSVNTSSTNVNNWSLLARQDIDASNIISGIVNTSRLGGGTANSDTVLTGGSAFLKNVFKMGIDANAPITLSSSSQEFPNGGTGIVTHYGTVNIGITSVAQSLDTYSTIGFAKFKNSTFAIDATGGVSIKNSSNGDIDAVSLESRSLAYVLNSANHTGAIPVTRGGTGLSAAPANGAFLQGNGTGYNLTTSPTFTGQLKITASVDYALDINTNKDAKIVLRGTNNPYIRWRQGNTDRLYIQWVDSYNAPLYRNQESSYHYFRGNNSGGIILQDNGGTNRGYLYHDGGNSFGLLDRDGQWVVRSVRDSHVEFRDNNEAVFTVGQGGHSSNYGTVCTQGGGRGGWEGYSINGRYVFMSADNNSCGLYNDIDNRWLIYYQRNDRLDFYDPDGGQVWFRNDNGEIQTFIHERKYDNDYLYFGSGADLRIHHNGSHHYFRNYNHGSGDYYFQGEDHQGSNHALLYLITNGNNPYVDLYYDGDLKLRTISNGIQVYGRVYARGGFQNQSDSRLKDNVEKINNALEKIEAIRGVTFDWNEKSKDMAGIRDYGVIAQEVEPVLPELVEEREEEITRKRTEEEIEDDGTPVDIVIGIETYKVMNYNGLIPVLIEGVKELSEKLNIIETRLNSAGISSGS